MGHYKAPLRDIQFVRNELLDMPQYFQSQANWEEVTPDLVDAILEECSKFCESILTPLNAIGDSEGCHFDNGTVTTPSGFKKAYQQFTEDGWSTLESPVEYGGQGLPRSLAISVTEMTGTANWSWGMYPGLSKGASHTIEHHGTEQQRNTYLPPLIEGKWTGTMCLTEAHCGTDLGLLRTKAELNADGSYVITGSKIFISSGEHDLTDNIVHIVLARLPDAPKGTKGISLFIVPKVLVNKDGSLGERNGVSCGSLEEKMGIHGNATCVMNFDGAKGYLIGAENRGLNCMFTFMNAARIGTAMQGLAHTEYAYQNSLAYAKDRLQMRALSGPAAPDKAADPIIVHPDVRRMLLTQKAFAEGARMLIYHVALLGDKQDQAKNKEEAAQYEEQLAFLTPIAKAFMTETGFEAANLGMQVFGGHGYIREWGMEQNVRDCRISMLYEGTTGIQSLDLLGRKVLMTGGETLKAFTRIIHLFCEKNKTNTAAAEFINPLAKAIKEWGELTQNIGQKARENPEEVNAACVDYLMYSGYVTYAYFFARAALIAQQALNNGSEERSFYEAKVYLARFFYQRLLPRTEGLKQTMLSGVENLLDTNVDPFVS